jgi:hypothetical protein
LFRYKLLLVFPPPAQFILRVVSSQVALGKRESEREGEGHDVGKEEEEKV